MAIPGPLSVTRIHTMSPRAATEMAMCFSSASSIVERCQWAIGDRSLDATLDCLVMHAQSLTYGEERRVVAVCQQHLRSLDVACRLRPRPRYGA